MVNSQNTRRKEAISNQVRRSLLRVSMAKVRMIRWVLMTIALMEALNHDKKYGKALRDQGGKSKHSHSGNHPAHKVGNGNSIKNDVKEENADGAIIQPEPW